MKGVRQDLMTVIEVMLGSQLSNTHTFPTQSARIWCDRDSTNVSDKIQQQNVI